MSAIRKHDDDQGACEQLGRSRLEAFTAIAENSPDLLLRFDRQLRHVYVNPAAERRMRRQRHAIRGKTQRELGISGDGLWDDELERVFRSGGERRFTFALGSNWVDAHEHFEARAVAELGARGEVETVLVMVRDVTERRRAEEELERRAAELARAQRIAGCGSFEWGLASDALTVSDELRRLLPLPAHEPASLADLLEVVHAEDRERVRRTLERVSGSEPGWSMQFRARDRDGVERVLHSRGELVADERGQPLRLVGTALDVTEQEDVQSTVRQLLRFSQFAVEHASDAVVWIDPMGCVVSANGAACERFGRSQEALAGKPLAMLGLMEPAEGWPARWLELKRAGRLRYEVARSGDAPVEVTAHYASIQGRDYGCLFVREPRAQRTDGRELRTSLQTILLWAELLARDDDPTTRARGLAMIAESAQSQERLLDALLGGGSVATAPAAPVDSEAALDRLGDDDLEIRSVGPLHTVRAQAQG